MNNLIAYMPVINRQYVDWLIKSQPFSLYLVTKDMAESLIPRLERNMVALAANDISRLLKGVRQKAFPRSSVDVFDPIICNRNLVAGPNGRNKNWIMPDEDISHSIAEKYLIPVGCTVKFESIWARWDMTAVKRQEPILPDMEVSSREIDKLRIMVARKIGQKTPDCWRQIGALAFREDEMIACAYCKHFPTEYETFIFGDLRINFDAGDPANAKIYISLHAEEGIITACAREGVPLKGASVYVTTFPCSDCARMLADCQIKELFFQDGYSVLKGFESLKGAGVRIVKVNT